MMSARLQSNTPPFQVEIDSTMIPNEKHPGFNLASSQNAPRGPILLTEKQRAHTQFHKGSPNKLTVLLRITAVRTLVNQDETADSWFDDDVEVITTTTVDDKFLSELDWEKELQLIQKFQPDFHIPCDYPVYEDDDPDIRRHRILNSLEGMIWIAEKLHSSKTRIIPLLKGTTPQERRLCYKVFDHVGIEYCVFYGTQYFTASIGFNQLLEDLRTVVSESPELEIMLIGLQSARRLKQLPPQIVASAGQRWIDKVQLREVSWKESQRLYESMEQEINKVLRQGQMPITAWSQNGVTA
jgi:hypothetical protein